MASPYPLHTILFLDIETVSQYPAFGDVPPEWQELWRHKADALNRDKAPITPEDVYGRSAIYAEFGKVVCISCGVLSGPPAGRKLSIKSFYGDDEKDLLTRFYDLLHKWGSEGQKYLCAHNGKEFDFPYLCRRMIIHGMKLPEGVRVKVRGSAQAMQTSFSAFGFGLILATLLVYLILVAQFQSFIDPLLILYLTGTTLNVMSLMGVVMMVGIVVSNSILIVEFTNRLRAEGHSLREAVSLACRVRLRPVLMTSLATLMGLIPMALKLGTGSEAYAPLARAIIGGLAVSVVLTVFIVPAAYYVVHRNDKETGDTRGNSPSGSGNAMSVGEAV